jgi:predicted dithiol-disulfide oxidoreductase (DUF899 family)
VPGLGSKAVGRRSIRGKPGLLGRGSDGWDVAVAEDVARIVSVFERDEATVPLIVVGVLTRSTSRVKPSYMVGQNGQRLAARPLRSYARCPGSLRMDCCDFANKLGWPCVSAWQLSTKRGSQPMPEHRTATVEDWNAARAELMEREKELTRMSDELARKRRELPWLRVEKQYTFQTADGPKTLAELFDGRSQLAVYHFMYGLDYEAGCPVCSSIADSFNGVVSHLKARDVTMICISHAPLENLLAYRERMGWSFNWASSYESEFNFDFEHSQTREQVSDMLGDEVPAVVSQFASQCGTDPIGYVSEAPGLSVFALSNEDVYLTYSTTARGLEPVMVYYGILDRVPGGREDDGPPDPSWIRRHDEFAVP